MRNRFIPLLSITLSFLLLALPIHAAPVVINDVVQVLTSYQNPPSLRLRSFSQISSPLNYGVDDLGQSPVKESGNKSTSGRVIESPNSLLSGVAVDAGSQPFGVQIVDEGDVEGTVCDCGEILVAGGPPKWPLIFLAAIPLFFIHHCDDCDTPVPTPTPPSNQSSPTPTPTPTPTVTPPPSQVPEPTSWLLLASGLVAAGTFLRKRYWSQLVQDEKTEEGGKDS